MTVGSPPSTEKETGFLSEVCPKLSQPVGANPRRENAVGPADGIGVLGRDVKIVPLPGMMNVVSEIAMMVLLWA
jgi:hypothetical protein